jgi:hypothetical protein
MHTVTAAYAVELNSKPVATQISGRPKVPDKKSFSEHTTYLVNARQLSVCKPLNSGRHGLSACSEYPDCQWPDSAKPGEGSRSEPWQAFKFSDALQQVPQPSEQCQPTVSLHRDTETEARSVQGGALLFPHNRAGFKFARSLRITRHMSCAALGRNFSVIGERIEWHVSRVHRVIIVLLRRLIDCLQES